MAYTEEGFLGDFHGRLGNLVVYKLKGKTVIRTLPSKKRGPAKGRLKASQSRFSQIMNVLKGIQSYVKTGFYDVSDGAYVFQRALAANIECYMASEDPADYHWLLLSKGERAGAQDLALEMGEGQATVRWGEPEAGKPFDPTDRVMLLALNTTTLESTENTNAAIRNQGQAGIALPPAKAGEKVLVSISFMDLAGSLLTCDPKNISTSQLLE